jgi:hypothetical protein
VELGDPAAPAARTLGDRTTVIRSLTDPADREETTLKTLRTPDERFVGLVDHDFAANYAEIDDLDGGTLRLHSLDEGPAGAAPVMSVSTDDPAAADDRVGSSRAAETAPTPVIQRSAVRRFREGVS